MATINIPTVATVPGRYFRPYNRVPQSRLFESVSATSPADSGFVTLDANGMAISAVSGVGDMTYATGVDTNVIGIATGIRDPRWHNPGYVAKTAASPAVTAWGGLGSMIASTAPTYQQMNVCIIDPRDEFLFDYGAAVALATWPDVTISLTTASTDATTNTAWASTTKPTGADVTSIVLVGLLNSAVNQMTNAEAVKLASWTTTAPTPATRALYGTAAAVHVYSATAALNEQILWGPLTATMVGNRYPLLVGTAGTVLNIAAPANTGAVEVTGVFSPDVMGLNGLYYQVFPRVWGRFWAAGYQGA